MKYERGMRILSLAILLGLGGSAIAREPCPDDDKRAQTGASTQYQKETRGSETAGNNPAITTEADLEARIWSKYAMESSLSPYQITIDVQGGRVVLRGEVEQASERQLAERLAKEVDGIITVDNQIVIASRVATGSDDRATAQNEPMKPGRSDGDRDFGQVVSDASITAAVKSRLLWNRETDGLMIDVDTRNGRVALNGAVDNDLARQTAERLAKDTTGVIAVDNHLRVQPDQVAARSTQDQDQLQPVNDAWITAKVKSSLLYSANVDGMDFTVHTENGRVHLGGVASDQNELAQAVEIARDINGVIDVDSSDVRVQS